jgi:hypothetical protein
MHRAHAAQLVEVYAGMGGHADEASSIVGIVHTAVANRDDATRAGKISDTQDIVRGEEDILDRYETAAAATEEHAETHEAILQQRDTLRREIDRLQR